MNWWRTGIVVLVCEVLIAAGLARLAGVPVAWSALLGLPVVAVLGLFLRAPAAVEPLWSAPPEPPSSAAYLAASTLAGRLDDAFADQNRFRVRIQPRLAALALATLRRRPGLGDLPGLTDPRVAAALGPELHALVTDPAARLPQPARLLALLDELERT